MDFHCQPVYSLPESLLLRKSGISDRGLTSAAPHLAPAQPCRVVQPAGVPEVQKGDAGLKLQLVWQAEPGA